MSSDTKLHFRNAYMCFNRIRVSFELCEKLSNNFTLISKLKKKNLKVYGDSL